jgi:hypothetical protein
LISAVFGREGEILSRFLLAQFFPPSLPKGRSANHKELAPPLKATGVEKNGRNKCFILEDCTFQIVYLKMNQVNPMINLFVTLKTRI